MTPLLSVLIPSIPSRLRTASHLFDMLAAYSDGLSVELLMLTDNKQRSIGSSAKLSWTSRSAIT